jgi:hypothetical protein
VGVNKREAVAVLQVLKGHALDERRFPRAGLTDDVYVRKPVFILDPEHAAIIPKIYSAYVEHSVLDHRGMVTAVPTSRQAGQFANSSNQFDFAGLAHYPAYRLRGV